jgi:hypothetical protein
MLIKINNDLYDISKRIKEIDENYIIYYDTSKSKYLLYNKNRYQLTFPYRNLDTRALNYAWDTRIENLDTLIAKVDSYNEEMQYKKLKQAHDEVECMASKNL